MHSVAAARRVALIARATSSSSSRSVGASRRMPLSPSLALSSSPFSSLSSSLQRPDSTSSRIFRNPSHYARRQHLRCFASRKEEDKSWGEIAGDAADVAKGALKKLGVGALTAIEKVLGGGGEESKPTTQRTESSRFPEQQRRQRRRDDPLSDLGFGGPGGRGGLLGNVVGSLLGKAVQGAFQAISEQTREASALAEAALEAANNDSAVRAEFGGRLSKAGGDGFGSMAQSSSTVIVNGRTRRDTTVSFPVVGPSGPSGGGGFLEARARDGETLVVRVSTPRGRVIDVGRGGGSGGGAGGSSGDVIDVDFREV